MFAMCLNQTILREFPTSVNYIISIGVVPLTLFVCVFAIYGVWYFLTNFCSTFALISNSRLHFNDPVSSATYYVFNNILLHIYFDLNFPLFSPVIHFFPQSWFKAFEPSQDLCNNDSKGEEGLKSSCHFKIEPSRKITLPWKSLF